MNEPLSNIAFKFTLRRYNEGVGGHSLQPGVSIPANKRGTPGHRMVGCQARPSMSPLLSST
jgi:hypothetical protein